MTGKRVILALALALVFVSGLGVWWLTGSNERQLAELESVASEFEVPASWTFQERKESNDADCFFACSGLTLIWSSPEPPEGDDLRNLVVDSGWEFYDQTNCKVRTDKSDLPYCLVRGTAEQTVFVLSAYGPIDERDEDRATWEISLGL